LRRLAEVTDAPTAWAKLAELAAERTGELAFDIGANIGQAAKILAPFYKHVLSFEPCEESFAVLMEEAPQNVEPHALAISKASGKVVLAEAETATSYGQLVNPDVAYSHPEWGSCQGSREVQATTIDELVRHSGLVPDLVKIDTEGHEPWVIAGAQWTVGIAYTSWFIEVHSATHMPDIEAEFSYGSYHLELVEHDYLKDNLRGNDHFYVIARPKWRG
jgi:FkbM family methyltransferase